MPCFGSNNDDESRYPLLRIKCPTPTQPEDYLPRVTEHIVQDETDDVIDDPSSVFFDPNEKPGFVYTHVPALPQFDYAKQLVLMLPNDKQNKIKTFIHKSPDEKTISEKDRERNMSVCSDFADSLDRPSPSLPSTPLPIHESTGVATSNTKTNFNEHFKPISRQDSLEYDPIVDNSICQVTLNGEKFHRPSTSEVPTGLSEDDVRNLYKNSHDPFFIDDFNDMHIYNEDHMLNRHNHHDTTLNHIKTTTNSATTNKGYISDAESVKTYQDSGIYDDDIIMDSPSRLHHPKRGNELFDEEETEDAGMQMEKYSAFKTPLSSRHNSLEYLPLDSPLKSIIKHPRKGGPDPLPGGTLDTGQQQNNGKAGSENDSLDNELKETFADLEASERRKKGDKYSHIQAKVQCFRRKAEKSPPCAPIIAPARKRTPEPPQTRNTKKIDLKRTQSRIGVKPKVDSLSNVKYTPGGGSAKVFKEKLKFRENAQPRTDTHGIEMYAHLPTEFQEIARRLARQDNQLKEQKTSPRGRSLQRQGSAPNSRPQSLSPKRGRSCTKKGGKKGAYDGISTDGKKSHKLTDPDNTIVKRPTLSRSSSIRSVPPAPKIHERHPSSSKITRPSPSQPVATTTTTNANTTRLTSENNNKTAKKKPTAKIKNAEKLKDQKATSTAPPPTMTSAATMAAATTVAGKSKTKKTKNGCEKPAKVSKVKREATTATASITKTAQILTQNTLKMAENTAKIAQGIKQLNESTLDSQDASSVTTTSMSTSNEKSMSNEKSTDRSTSSDRSLSENISSLSQYISENESFGTRTRGVGLGSRDETKTNPLSSLCQYITEHELLDSSRRSEDISTNLMFHVPDNQFMETSKLPTSNRFQTVQAH